MSSRAILSHTTQVNWSKRIKPPKGGIGSIYKRHRPYLRHTSRAVRRQSLVTGGQPPPLRKVLCSITITTGSIRLELDVPTPEAGVVFPSSGQDVVNPEALCTTRRLRLKPKQSGFRVYRKALMSCNQRYVLIKLVTVTRGHFIVTLLRSVTSFCSINVPHKIET